jgi:hypothetical protein
MEFIDFVPFDLVEPSRGDGSEASGRLIRGGLSTEIMMNGDGFRILSFASPAWVSACESRTSAQTLLKTGRSRQLSSHEMLNLFVYHVLRIVNHFHQFHLKKILD